jgi:hypothetical protein
MGARRTAVTIASLARGFIAAFASRGLVLSPAVLAIVFAKVCRDLGWPGAGQRCWGFNLLLADPEDPRFRPYDSIETAAEDYCEALSRSFPRAWTTLLEADAGAFVDALQAEHYDFGSEDVVTYRRTVTRIAEGAIGPAERAIADEALDLADLDKKDNGEVPK